MQTLSFPYPLLAHLHYQKCLLAFVFFHSSNPRLRACPIAHTTLLLPPRLYNGLTDHRQTLVLLWHAQNPKKLGTNMSTPASFFLVIYVTAPHFQNDWFIPTSVPLPTPPRHLRYPASQIWHFTPNRWHKIKGLAILSLTILNLSHTIQLLESSPVTRPHPRQCHHYFPSYIPFA